MHIDINCLLHKHGLWYTSTAKGRGEEGPVNAIHAIDSKDRSHNCYAQCFFRNGCCEPLHKGKPQPVIIRVTKGHSVQLLSSRTNKKRYSFNQDVLNSWNSQIIGHQLCQYGKVSVWSLCSYGFPGQQASLDEPSRAGFRGARELQLQWAPSWGGGAPLNKNL